MFSTLLTLHIICGSIAILCAAIAIGSAKGQKTHRKAGRIFFYAMTGVFLTALCLALLKGLYFLLAIALFSYYFALQGWRHATNHTGRAQPVDWAIIVAMLLIGAAMIASGAFQTPYHDFRATLLIIFGALGISSALKNWKAFKQGDLSSKKRIRLHLSAMLGATIAILTAVAVVNIHWRYDIVIWLLPTIVITPLIIWWNRRYQ